MRTRALLLLLTAATAVLVPTASASCSSDLAFVPSADAGADEDAFVRETPPACAPIAPPAPPACGTATARGSLVPGPADPGHDAMLAAKTRRFDRAMRAIHLLTTGANTEVVVANEAERGTITAFLRDSDGWDLAAFAGKPAEQVVSGWAKVAGAYAGAGALADAYRYAALRDEGASCEEVERARAHVRTALEALHRAVAITGKRGVIARGYQRVDVPGEAHPTTPLFDGAGSPLPPEKDNGTWRADQSGQYPSYVWEDSCSRDMLVGWVMGMAAVWEVVSSDPTFETVAKQTLADDALAIAESMMKVGPQGYDLEIADADGRRTFHGVLHERGVERGYITANVFNGQYAIMSLGIMAALARISGSPKVLDYVHNDLVRARRLHEISRDYQDLIHLGSKTNYSNYNMAFTGGWLATRYLCTPEAAETMREVVAKRLYAPSSRAPREQGQAFYDWVALAAGAGASATTPLDPARIDRTAAENALATLREFHDAPYWNTAVENCDAAEIEARSCVAVDGTPIDLLGAVGRGEELVAAKVVPMRIRPPSNYHWRSDPYRVNGTGDGTTLFPGVDYRAAYWMARYLR